MTPLPSAGDTGWGATLNSYLTTMDDDLTIQEGTGSNNSLKVAPTSNKSASTSVGGAILVENTNSTGAGVVVYSNQSAPSGRLLVLRADHASFNQAVQRIDNDGTGASVSINATNASQASSAVDVTTASGGGSAAGHAIGASVTGSGNATGGSAGSFSSANTANSTLQVSGVETGRGTVKVTHTGTGSDGNAAALSIDLAGSGTAAQGVFITSASGTTGDLIDARNGSSAFRWRLTHDGYVVETVNTSAYSTSAMWNGSMAVHVDEGSNLLTFTVKYSTGTVKTGAVSLSS